MRAAFPLPGGATDPAGAASVIMHQRHPWRRPAFTEIAGAVVVLAQLHLLVSAVVLHGSVSSVPGFIRDWAEFLLGGSAAAGQLWASYHATLSAHAGIWIVAHAVVVLVACSLTGGLKVAASALQLVAAGAAAAVADGLTAAYASVPFAAAVVLLLAHDEMRWDRRAPSATRLARARLGTCLVLHSATHSGRASVDGDGSAPDAGRELMAEGAAFCGMLGRVLERAERLGLQLAGAGAAVQESDRTLFVARWFHGLPALLSEASDVCSFDAVLARIKRQ
jgi:hypothetical protein